MERRTFLQILFGAATSKVLPEKLAEAPPQLPIPKHEAISILHNLRLSFGRKGSPNLGNYAHPQAFHDWELNSSGIFVNKSPIEYDFGFRPSFVDKVYLQDPDKIWLCTEMDFPEVIYGRDLVIFNPGQIQVTPESLATLKSNMTLSQTIDRHRLTAEIEIRAPRKYEFVDEHGVIKMRTGRPQPPPSLSLEEWYRKLRLKGKKALDAIEQARGYVEAYPKMIRAYDLRLESWEAQQRYLKDSGQLDEADETTSQDAPGSVRPAQKTVFGPG